MKSAAGIDSFERDIGMLFNSLAFAMFLPVVFVLYWCLPHKYRWGVLLISSYYFYMSWNPKYVMLIFLTTFAAYLAGRLLEHEENECRRKSIVVVTSVLCLGILFVFKYYNFFSENLVNILQLVSIQLHPITLNLLLPVGISFYTFQTLSYVLDVYKRKVPVEHHFGIFATFISFFPQLVAGPIERTENLLPQINKEKVFSYEQATGGLRLMAWGFFKKLAIADVLAIYVDAAYASLDKCAGIDCLCAIVFFSIQIYCDFSGYSDIAIGTARLLGIELMTNFHSPYCATSVKEFWSRWHISLSTWFRDYLYIPLGGNRGSKWQHYSNIMLTFLVSGLWHGANWTFILWGGMHGIALVMENCLSRFLSVKGRLGKIVSGLTVFIFCNLAWVMFRASSVNDFCLIISNLWTGLGNWAEFKKSTIGLNASVLRGIAWTIAVLMLYDFVSVKSDVLKWLATRNIAVRWAVYLAIVFYIILNMPLQSSSFIYFQF